MFEAAEIGHRISKARYRREEPALRQALLEAQYRLLDKPEFPLLILIGGLDGAGKGETVNLLNEWMDPRHIRTEAFGLSGSAWEGGRPEMWRFWQVLPPTRQDRRLLRLLVHRSARAPGRRHDEAHRLRAPAGDHPPLRAHAGGRGRAGAEALVPPVEVRAEEEAARAGRGSAHGVAGHARGVEAPRQVRALREGHRRDPARDRHRRGAVAGDRGFRRTLSRAHGRPRGARCAHAPARRTGAGDIALGAAAGAGHRRPRPAELARLLAQDPRRRTTTGSSSARRAG